MLGKTEGRRRGDGRGRGCWMASPTQWTWVWISFRSWWWTGRPGVLRFMGFAKSWTRLSDWTELILMYRRRQWHPTPVLLPVKSYGRRSLVGCSPWGRKESDTTEWLHFQFSFSCTGEGNGNPLQCSCLENPRDGGARWAAVYGVAQSRTWLKRLSSSSSILMYFSLCLAHIRNSINICCLKCS